jgi:hypothetical protein
MGFDPSEDGSEHDRDKGEEGGGGGEFAESIGGAWDGAYERYEGGYCGEADGADGAVGHGVEILGTCEDVEGLKERLDIQKGVQLEEDSCLNECIVEEKHDRCKIPRYFGVPVEHLANIADISDFRVTETHFPDAYQSAWYML